MSLSSLRSRASHKIAVKQATITNCTHMSCTWIPASRNTHFLLSWYRWGILMWNSKKLDSQPRESWKGTSLAFVVSLCVVFEWGDLAVLSWSRPKSSDRTQSTFLAYRTGWVNRISIIKSAAFGSFLFIIIISHLPLFLINLSYPSFSLYSTPPHPQLEFKILPMFWNANL